MTDKPVRQSMEADGRAAESIVSALYDALTMANAIKTDRMAELMAAEGVTTQDAETRERRISNANAELFTQIKAAIETAELLQRRCDIGIEEVAEAQRRVKR